MKAILKSGLRRWVPDTWKRRCLQACFNALSPEGRLPVSELYQIPSLEWSLRNFRRAGFRPRTVVDVGAYVGHWTQTTASRFPEARFLMVEPQGSKEPVLREVCKQLDVRATHSASLLGRSPSDDVPFHEMETSSSLLHERSQASRTLRHHAMTTLDRVRASHLPNPLDFPKLDVQGAELEVLAGATQTLPNVQVIQMEVSFLPVIEGAPLLAETVAFLAEDGFRAYDICEFIRRPLDHALWQADFIFVAESSPLLARLDLGA